MPEHNYSFKLRIAIEIMVKSLKRWNLMPRINGNEVILLTIRETSTYINGQNKLYWEDLWKLK